MSYPILNKSETYKNVQFYLESTSFKSWLVAPTDNPWYHSRPTSVSGRTIINARKEFLVASSIIEEFSRTKGNVQISPIPITKYSENLELDFSYSNPHQIKFDVLDGLPYPSVIFSATLVNSEPDFDQLLQEITERLNLNSLFRGELAMDFTGVDLLNRSLLTYNLRDVLTAITQILKTQEHTKWNLYKEINSLIASNFNSFVNTDFSQLSSKEKDKLIDFLCNYLATVVVYSKTNQQYFNGEISFEQIVLRDPLEFEDKRIERTLLNSSLVTKTFHIN